MRMRSIHDNSEFDAELTTQHPPSIPGPLAIQRSDTGEFIAIRDVFSVQSRLFDLLEVSEEERAQLSAAGVMLVEPEVMDAAMKSRMDIQDLIPKVVQQYRDYGHARPTLYAQLSTSSTPQAYPLLNFVGDGRMKAHQLFVEGRRAGLHHPEQALLETCLVSEATFRHSDSKQQIDGVMFASAPNSEPFQTVIRAYAIKQDKKKGKASELKLLSESVDPEGLMGLAFICGWRSRALSENEVRALQPKGMRAFLSV
jgi:hypothetical protein